MEFENLRVSWRCKYQMASLKELAGGTPNLLTGGHRLCAGCGAPIIVRQVLAVAGRDVVISCATGCLEVATSIYPYTSWAVPFIHNAFENAAATISGVESAYKVLRRRGKLSKDIKFITFGGDGGTYDIGLQSLSGAMERGHRMLYVCYDNGAYMNTGIQRSSATPRGANTTTSPVGKGLKAGKPQYRKDLTGIMAAHDIPYVAQVSPYNWRDLTKKVEKALSVDGPSFINALSPCPRGWITNTPDTIELTRVAVDTCFWPLYEVEDGRWKVNYKPKEKRPLIDWLKMQGRFKHLFNPENQGIIEELQADVNRRWEKLLNKAGESV